MIFEATKKVFREKRYLLLAVLTGLFAFAFAVLFPNIKLLSQFFNDSAISIYQKMLLLFNLFGSITVNFTLFTASYTILISILFGMNTALLAFHIRNRISTIKQSGTVLGVMGIASGILGIGCAACGSIVISLILPIFGGGAFLSFLPLQGGEFGILSIILLSLSYYLIAKEIQKSKICAL